MNSPSQKGHGLNHQVWYIYLYYPILVDVYGFHVGKYASIMDPMGLFTPIKIDHYHRYIFDISLNFSPSAMGFVQQKNHVVESGTNHKKMAPGKTENPMGFIGIFTIPIYIYIYLL